MMPVLEISKRRSHLKQIPPGFSKEKKNNYDVNNNYSTVTNQERVACHISEQKQQAKQHKGTDKAIANIEPQAHIQANSQKLKKTNRTITEILLKIDSQTIVHNVNFNSNTPNIRRNSCLAQVSHMMPVLEVARKRAIDHAVPPGFKQLPILDANNNADRNEKRNSARYSARESRYLSKSRNRSSGKGNPIVGCFEFVKSEVLLTSEEIESLKPDCLKGNEDKQKVTKDVAKVIRGDKKEKTFSVWKCKMGKIKEYIHPSKIKEGLKEGLKIGKKQIGPIFIKADVTKDMIGGEEAVVNLLPFDPQEVEDAEGLEIRDYTPENFYETCDYFEIVSNNRKHVTRLIYTLGDMLLANELEGGREEWKEYTDKMHEEELVWKKRCREDDVIFEKTGRSSGVKDVLWSSYFVKYVKDTVTQAKNCISRICPCFFEKT